MKTFRERNTALMGLGLVVAVVLLISVVFNINTITGMFGKHYSAIFSEAGGLKAGDPVEVSGLDVGRVTDVQLSGPAVKVSFNITNNDVHLGDLTQASVDVATVLGDKALKLTSGGTGALSSGSQIPLTRTASPYDVTQALSTLTTDVGQIDLPKVSAAFDEISKTLNGSAPQIRAAISGVGRLAETIGSRDDVLRSLLGHANTFSSVLAGRTTDLQVLIKDGNTLFAELLQRRQQISTLLSNVSSMSIQLSALIDDNSAIVGPALKQLDGVIALLKRNESNIDKSLKGLAVYGTGLGEVVSAGPFFSAYLQNLLPGNMLPPTITVPGLTGGK